MSIPLPSLPLLDMMLRAMVLGQLLMLGGLLLRETSTVVTRLLLACGLGLAICDANRAYHG